MVLSFYSNVLRLCIFQNKEYITVVTVPRKPYCSHNSINYIYFCHVCVMNNELYFILFLILLASSLQYFAGKTPIVVIFLFTNTKMQYLKSN